MIKVQHKDTKQYSYIWIIWILVLVICFAQGRIYAQDTIKVGSFYPDIHLSHIINAPYTEARVSDFRGKLLIFYSWTTYCGPCIEYFPVLDSLQRKYDNDIKIILVNHQKEETIRNMFDKMKLLGVSYQLPNVIMDFQSFRQFLNVDGTLGGTIWIDKDGLLIGKSAKINKDNIEAALKQGYNEIGFKKATTNSNTRNDTVEQKYVSKLTGYNPALGDYSIFFKYPDSIDSNSIIKLNNMSIDGLYLNAYTAIPELDMPRQRIEWHVRDSLYYLPHLTNWDSLKYEVGFCYELMLPNTPKSEMLIEMRKDLDRYFKLRTEKEIRQVKCIKLIKIADSIPVSQGGKSITEKDNFGIRMVNQPVSVLVSALGYYMRTKEYPEFIDATDISYPIDLKLVVNWRADNNFQAVREVLQKVGFDLVEDLAEIHVLHLFEHRQMIE